MRDVKQIGVRLNQHEAKAIEQLAKAQDVSVSELVRSWLQEAAKQMWQANQQQKGA